MPEKETFVDMTKGREFEVIPGGTRVLLQVDAWAEAPAGTGAPMLKVEFVVQEPKPFANKRIFENYVLNHEVGIGRYKAMLRVLGVVSDEELDNPKHTTPAESKVLGKPLCAILGIKSDPNGQYADKNVIRRVLPASAYEEAA